MSKLFNGVFEKYVNDEEQWKDIYFIQNGIEWDYRGLYQVSNHGRVKSLGNDKVRKEKILKAGKNTIGYEYVGLCKNSKQKNFLIQRLVAHMFLSDSYFEGAEVNHKDENKTNNHVYNVNYGTRNERIGKKVSESMKGELVAQIEPSTEKIINLKYSFEYKKILGFTQSSISNCCRGSRYKTHKGYIWKYISDCTDEQINEYIIKNKQINIE